MDQKSPEPPKILDKMSMATMTSPIIFWSHILKLKAGHFVVDLCDTVPFFHKYRLDSTLLCFGGVFSHYSWVPSQYDGHYSNASETLQHYLYNIWHKHDTWMEDLGVIVYLLLHCGGGVSDSRTTVFIFVQPFTSLQSFRNGSSSFFFFLPFPERVTFMTHQVMPSLTGQSGLAVFWRHIFVPGTKCTTWWKL